MLETTDLGMYTVPVVRRERITILTKKLRYVVPATPMTLMRACVGIAQAAADCGLLTEEAESMLEIGGRIISSAMDARADMLLAGEYRTSAAIFRLNAEFAPIRALAETTPRKLED